MEYLDSLPILGIFIGTLLLVSLSAECGYLLARNRKRSAVEKEVPVGAMVNALLGLLAFLLAFTFGFATDRYHERKVALVNEVNTIRAAYQKAGMIPEPYSTRTRVLLREYVEERLQWAGVKKRSHGRSAKELLNQLWAQAELASQHSSEVVALFIESVSRVIDLHTTRVILRDRSRIPGEYWFVVYLLAVFALLSMGYHAGVAGTSRSPITVAVALGFSLVIMLIIDIDRPGQGFINVSQQAMIDLQDWMAASRP